MKKVMISWICGLDGERRNIYNIFEVKLLEDLTEIGGKYKNRYNNSYVAVLRIQLNLFMIRCIGGPLR
jgi:hypothetical protein